MNKNYINYINPIGRSWAEVREEIFTPKEIAEANLKIELEKNNAKIFKIKSEKIKFIFVKDNKLKKQEVY